MTSSQHSLDALDLIDSLVQSPAWLTPPPATDILPPALVASLAAASATLPASPTDPAFQPFLDAVRESGRSALQQCNIPCPPPPPPSPSDPAPPIPTDQAGNNTAVLTDETKSALISKIDSFVSLYKSRIKPWTTPVQPTYTTPADLGKIARMHMGTARKVKQHVDKGAEMLQRLRRVEKMHSAAASAEKATSRTSLGAKKRRKSGGARRRSAGARASLKSSR